MYKKLIMGLSVVAALSACTSAPLVKKEPVTGQLSNAREVALGVTKSPAATGALFDTSGYTIIGVAYVMAAKSKMDAQTAELSKSYAQYVKDTPGAKPLKQVYVDELNAELAKRNVKVKMVDVTPTLSEDKKTVTYGFDAKDTNAQKMLVIGNLISIYHAPSSTDSYRPRSSVHLSIVDPKMPNSQATHADSLLFTSEDVAFEYPGYEDITKDIGHSYAGLVANTQNLARMSVSTVLGK